MSVIFINPYRFGVALDPDAAAYIASVETADGQALEDGVKAAINDFVVGCKTDSIWSAIKASCILAGARTLNGALQPLVGTAPTNFNFVSGDYNRKTGLVGNGSSKYLNSNRNNNADPQDNKHHSVLISSLSTINTTVYNGAGAGGVAGQSGIIAFLPSINFRVNSAAAESRSQSTGFCGCSRSGASSFQVRISSSTFTSNITSQSPLNENIGILGRTIGTSHANARLAFYSIGESLDLALLDARVTALINAFAAAIP